MKKQTKTKDGKAAGAREAVAPPGIKPQPELFASAMTAFWAGQYAKAKALFEEAAKGGNLSVSESSQMYIRMCERRMAAAQVELTSPEDHYLYGVSLMNAQQYGEAKGHLEAAVAASPAPHYLYAFSIASGMLGAVQDAAQSLRRAIALDPSIRALARNDPDFAPLLEHAPIREALAGDKAGG